MTLAKAATAHARASSPGRIDEIQGLRGIAVAAVVLFHAQIPGLRGGFLGVDVFFVISGFVIGSLLKRDIDSGTFRFGDFYRRRAWRLMPALAATLLFTGALFGLLVPTALGAPLWPTLVAAAFGVSNFYFNGELDYFDSGLSNPALHTWSLGVEEQFYLVFPLLLVLLHRWRTQQGRPVHLFRWITALAVIGFAVAVLQTAVGPNHAFYLPWFRAWEFLAGAALAHGALQSGSLTSRRLGSLAGAALLLVPLLYYRESYVFPGIGALAPVLGTVLLIRGAGTGGVINRVLSSRPLTFVGDISYSLYLAHWPVICLVGMFLPLEFLRFATLALVCSVALGLALWRWVETPTRTGFRPHRPAWRAWLVPVTMASVAAGSYAANASGEWFWNRQPHALTYFQNSRPTQDIFRRDRCFLTLKSTLANYDRNACLPQRPGAPAMLVLGDSLAANLVTELQHRWPEVDVQQATAVDYKPGLPAPQRPPVTAELARFIEQQLLQPGSRMPHVLLYARWEREDLAPLRTLVNELHTRGYRTTVLGPSPQYYIALPFLAGYSEILGIDMVPLMTKPDRVELDREFAAALPASAGYISTMNILCPPNKTVPACMTKIGSDLLFFDKLHYTPVGARYLADRLPLP